MNMKTFFLWIELNNHNHDARKKKKSGRIIDQSHVAIAIMSKKGVYFCPLVVWIQN